MSISVSTLLLSSALSDDHATLPSKIAKRSAWTSLPSLILAVAFSPFKWFRKGRLHTNAPCATKTMKQEDKDDDGSVPTRKGDDKDINLEKKLEDQKPKKCHLPVSVRSRHKRPDSPTRPLSTKETSSETQQTEPSEEKKSISAFCAPETRENQAQALLPSLKSYLPKPVKSSPAENQNASPASSFMDSSLQTEDVEIHKVSIQTENVECENVEVMAVVPLTNAEIDASISVSFQNQCIQCDPEKDDRRKRSKIAVASRAKKYTEGGC